MTLLRMLAVLCLGLVLNSCAILGKDGDTAASGRKVPTVANTGYRGPSWAMPPHLNPDVRMSREIRRISGVSHSRGSSAYPYVAMTFDDGPHPRNTPRLLDMLRQRNIKATFYVIGQSVELYPEITRRIVVEGHEIGNHTWTHSNLTKLSDSAVRSEMTRTRSIIHNVTGVEPHTMRPPYGALLNRQREMIYEEFGYPTILWSVDPRDWQRPGPDVVTSRILSQTNNGAIILAHDLHAPTVDAMPGTLDGLLAKGYRFLTVSQLLMLKDAVQ
jgi:peptidoglycan/xylan/chitin deacetylase (PgdA/CDA1 family)